MTGDALLGDHAPRAPRDMTSTTSAHGASTTRAHGAWQQGRPNSLGRSLRMPAALLLAAFAVGTPAGAMTSHAGWPPDQHLVMDKGPSGRHNVLVGQADKHNYLLGGYGDDTIYGGGAGDVIWGDYHESGWPSRQTAIIHAGNGRNLIYANDTFNYVWTGSNPATVVHAHQNAGVIHCASPRIVVFTSHQALPHYKLDGCKRISFYSVGY